MKTFVKSIILFSVMSMYFLIGHWDAASAKVDYRGVSDSEREEIAEYLQTEEMLGQLSFGIGEDVTKDDISIFDYYKVNMFMFPVDAYDHWDPKESVGDMYSDGWFYQIPLIVKGEKTTVASLTKVNGEFKCAGVSYGKGNIGYFIDEADVKKTILEAGISEEEINYEDILITSLTYTLFIHINTVDNDYMIPYSSIDLSGRDLSEYYEAEMYKSGELYETYDILQMLVNASIVSLSKEKKEYENPYEVLLGGTGSTASGQSGTNNTGSESGGNGIKIFIISSILVLGCLVLAVFGINKYKKVYYK